MERAKDYKLPLCVAFIDNEKAFSVEISAVFNSVKTHRVEVHQTPRGSELKF